MKPIGMTLAALAVFSLFSCDIFLSPIKGRFNPADPDSDLVESTVTLYPVIDGYVSSAAPLKNFDDATFAAGMGTYGLLKFDIQGLPAIIKDVKLRIYHQNAASVTGVMVCRIGQDWNPTTVDHAQVISPGFILTEGSSGADVASDSYGVWDVTAMFNMGIKNGFVVSIAASSTFFASMEGTNKPQLVFNGFDYPETE